MINRIVDVAALIAGRWRWRKARTLTDLANLQANRIARNLTDLPATDPKRSMYSTLVALGRAGMVVDGWRPGTPPHGIDIDGDLIVMETRACVTGFADDETKDWLDNLLYCAGLEPGAAKYKLTSVLELYAPGCPEYDRSGGDDSWRYLGDAWVERIGDTYTARLGAQMDASQVYRAFPTRRSVQRELRKAWQITICAPTWGDHRMFGDLLALLSDSRRPATA